MVNEFFISKRIEISSELSGGGGGLRKVGFSHIMGYSKIIEELNKMHFERVYSIMNKLIKMGDLNKEFAEYIIYSEILDKDKFYQMDDMFNITENNLKNIFYDNTKIEVKANESDLEKKKLEEIYFKQLNKKISESDEKSDFENVDNEKFINKEYVYKVSVFKEELDRDVAFWLENNIKKMTEEDYGMLLYLINKIRKNGK